MVNATVAVVCLAIAIIIEWRGWGGGKSAAAPSGGDGDGKGKKGPTVAKGWNWGPRVGAIMLLTFGYAAFTGGAVVRWTRGAVQWAATTGGHIATAATTPGLGHGVAVAIPWLLTAGLAVIWLAALLPNRVAGDKMTWGLAWAGMFIPGLIATIPGPVGRTFVATFGWIATHTAAGVSAVIR